MKQMLLILTLSLLVSMGAMASVIDFETIDEFILGPEDYELAGDYNYYTSGNGLFFGYHYTDPWDYWGGFAASNRTIISDDDIYHQYTSTPGTDHTVGAAGTYAIGYYDYESAIGCTIRFAEPQDIGGAWFTTAAWTAEYMADNYSQDDYYRLIVTAYDSDLHEIGSRNVDLTNVTDWRFYNMTFDDVHALGITMETSDDWIPYYFCMDDLTTVPEPSTFLLLGAGVLGFIGARKK